MQRDAMLAERSPWSAPSTNQDRRHRLAIAAIDKLEAGLATASRDDLVEAARICFTNGWIEEQLRVQHLLIKV